MSIHFPSEEVIAAVEKYCRGYPPFDNLGIRSVRAHYQWELPSDVDLILGYIPSGTLFDQTKDMKRRLSERWIREPEERLNIAEWIIKRWGGIINTRKNKIAELVYLAENEEVMVEFAGISSYSKILSIVKTEKYPEFGARIAVSIHAIQILAEVMKGVAFRYPPGRNNITGNVVTGKGFSQISRYKTASLVKDKGWNRIRGRGFYKFYIDLLEEVKTRVPEVGSIADLEMALFAQAPELVCRVCPELRVEGSATE